jgi:oligoendopeptidase F
MPAKNLLKRNVALSLSILLFASTLPAQEKFEAIPKDLVPKYRFDLTRYFFADPAAERASRQELFATLEKLEKLKGRVTTTAENLLLALELSERLQQDSYRHWMYLNLRYSVNTKDESSSNESSQLFEKFAKQASFLQQELIGLSETDLVRFQRQKPELKAYSFVIEFARRYAPHTLTLKEEELIKELSPLSRDWTAALFQKARSRTQFGTVNSGDGPLDVYRQEGAIDNSQDRAVREEGFKKRYAGFASHRDLYAFSLSRLIKAANQIARLRHFKDSAEENHFGMFFDSAEVKDLYEKVALEAEVNKRYERARIARVKKLTGFSDVNVWDMSVVSPGFSTPRFDIIEATKILKESAAVYGPEYAKELSGLLDPDNRRLDIVPGENRAPSAFAVGYTGSETSLFYAFNYEGYFPNVKVLAHESAHAVQFRLMGNNHVLPSYVYGPPLLMEAIAIFNELVVIDYLYQHANDPQRKVFFLEQFMNQALNLYRNTMIAAMEQAIYDASADGKLLSADEMDSITKKVGSRFSIWFEKNDELKMRWISQHHFYTAPMSYPNYAYAALLALKFYEMYTKDPQNFVPRYVGLMRNGSDAPPAVLLKRFLGLDLRDPKLVSDTTVILNKKLTELESLYSSS